MKIYIPAWHYRARAIVQRTWGWSPIEEMILLALDNAPGTIEELASTLQVLPQIAGSTVARLMQFGLVEVRLSPRPVLATSAVGHDFIRSGRALPERSSDREVGISLVFEKVGHSIFRNRDVRTVPLNKIGPTDRVVAFPNGEFAETDESMAHRVGRFVSQTLRPGEWLRGVQATTSVIERKYLEIDLSDFKEGMVIEGATDQLIRALRYTIKTDVLPQAATAEAPATNSAVVTPFGPEHLLVGSERHLTRFEEIVAAAKSDVFVLSTFVELQSEERGKEQRERIWRALEGACRRGVRCHIFYGTTLDDRSKNAIAMQELNVRLSQVKQTRGFVLVQRDPVGSHAKFLAADDGNGGAVVVMGSCNWLSSPFAAVELSAELTGPEAVATGLDLLRAIVVSLSSASRSVEALQFMASELRRGRESLTGQPTGQPQARIIIVHAHEHERLLRKIAHEATDRFICSTNRVGANMVPALFNPAEVAGRRLGDVRVYYSRQTGPTKRRHVVAERERLNGVVEIIGVREPQVHSKFLAWDTDHVVVSSMNWGSQSGLPENPLDEIGIHIEGAGLATALMGLFEDQLKLGASIASSGKA